MLVVASIQASAFPTQFRKKGNAKREARLRAHKLVLGVGRHTNTHNIVYDLQMALLAWRLWRSNPAVVYGLELQRKCSGVAAFAQGLRRGLYASQAMVSATALVLAGALRVRMLTTR
jgi:hypothetical protein